MAYFVPYIDAAGLHLPSYTDIRDQLLADARDIFGIDIYLDADSQDYQWISIIARMIYDNQQLAEMVYNNRAPLSALGTALDGLVKINGISRQGSTRSTAILQLTGTAGTVLTGRYAIDASDRFWTIPDTVIGPFGSILATAVCNVPGAQAAEPNTINRMGNPTEGWISVTNPEAAATGRNSESDAALKARHAQSTARPSRTVLEGLAGDIMAVPDVGRTAFYENPTNKTSARGEPPHSITVVAEAGDETEIARRIQLRKTPGCDTYGTTEVSLPNPYGTPDVFHFFRPAYRQIGVQIQLHPLTGYTEAMVDEARANLIAYINGLQIGESVVVSSLYGPVLAAMPSLSNPAFSVQALTASLDGGAASTGVLTIAFTELAQTASTLIEIEVV